MLRRVPQFAYDLRIDTVKHPRQHTLSRLPDDPEDHDSDDQADDWVGERVSHPRSDRPGDDSQAGETVRPGMVAVGNQRSAVDLAADLNAKHGDNLVPDESDRAGGGKPA